MRKKVLIIIISLIAIIALLISIFIYRNNLTYGQNVLQKGAMYGCLNKLNKKAKYNNAENKRICECILNHLFDNYETEYLENNLETIIEKDKAILEKCYPKAVKNKNSNNLKTDNTTKNNIVDGASFVDTSKIYQKRSFTYQIGNEEKLIEELYITKDKDTFLNQYKFYYKNEIDTSRSKFYDLKVEGYENDSVLKGTIKFYSPRDTVPLDKINQRWVTFGFLQGDKDSLWFKEIETDTNVIHFDYVNFDSLTFSGYISDFRFIENDTIPSNKLILNRVYFAIDSKVSTNNAFVELLK